MRSAPSITPHLDVRQNELCLLCRVRNHVCALPLEHIAEVMRPLPVEKLPGVSRPVRGVAIIRGLPTPVVDIGWMVAAQPSDPTRFVSIKIGDRRVALAVDAVVGVRTIPLSSLRELPPLLRDASAEAITSIGRLDAELLVMLNSTRLVPETLWTALDAIELA